MNWRCTLSGYLIAVESRRGGAAAIAADLHLSFDIAAAAGGESDRRPPENPHVGADIGPI